MHLLWIPSHRLPPHTHMSTRDSINRDRGAVGEMHVSTHLSCFHFIQVVQFIQVRPSLSSIKFVHQVVHQDRPSLRPLLRPSRSSIISSIIFVHHFVHHLVSLPSLTKPMSSAMPLFFFSRLTCLKPSRQLDQGLILVALHIRLGKPSPCVPGRCKQC